MWDLHTHTTFSDGKATPEEMIATAIRKGMSKLGISDHSYTFFDETYCIKKDQIEKYRHCISALKEKYQEKIRVLLGVEQDYYSEEPTDNYDYVIGSVHYLKTDCGYIPVDENPEILIEAAKRHYNGDMYSLVNDYYETVSRVVEVTKANIIGHFDLIKKFNREGCLFDESDPRYTTAVKKALDRLLTYDVPFEINTGAISRGYRNDPYPSVEWISYIKDHGGRFVLSSDSHSTETLCFKFPEYTKMM